MKIRDLLAESVNIDNKNGAGCTTWNTDVDYFGFRAMMKPSIFLQLASTLSDLPTNSSHKLKDFIRDGGAIASPFLKVEIPYEWKRGDFSENAVVIGHEGRNRMTAILDVFGDEPVEVHILPYGTFRARDLTPEMKQRMSKSLIPQGSGAVKNGTLFTYQ